MLIPWWWAASPSITGLQLKMLAEISDLYGIEFSQHKTKPILASLTGGGLSFTIGQHPYALAFKGWLLSIPVVGIPLRFGTGPAIMAAYTWLLGHAFMSHYESGGTYESFRPSVVGDELVRALGIKRPQPAL